MSTRSSFRKAGLLGASLLLLAALAAPAVAQDGDGRWLAWVGCWEPVGESADGSLLCVREASGGVEVTTLMDGEVTGSEILSADGQRHDTDREGCSGWNAARFSYDARRVYVDSEHRCEGETLRATTGLIAMTSPHEWIEVESIDVGGRSVAWVKRYRAASFETTREAGYGDVVAARGMALESARMAASAPVGVEDVIEAVGQVDAEAVEAWLSETNDPLDLNAQSLLAMADAGVPESVIDVAVALSYPDHFAMEREEVDPRNRTVYMDYYGHRPRGFFGYYGSYYSPYSSYYSPWGYGGGYGYGGYGYGYRPAIVVVQPRGNAGGGRVIAGRGYRRSGGQGSGSAPSAASGSGKGSGGSSVAPPSSGSSSGGRKAKRKPGGSGG